MSLPVSIALLELEEHQEVLRYLLKVYADQVPTGLFTRRVLAEAFCASWLSSVETTLAESTESDEAYLKRILVVLDNYACLVVVSAGLQTKRWSLLSQLRCPKVLIIHNANTHFAREQFLQTNLLSRLRRLKWRLAGNWPLANTLRQAWSGFVVPTESVAAYVRDQGVAQPLLDAPWAIPQLHTESRAPSGAVLRLVVPGTVRQADRHWGPLREALMQTTRPLKLHLCGYVKGKGGRALVASLRQAAQGKHEIEAYPAGLSQKEYDQLCQEADALVLPLPGSMEYATVREWGGRSKISGGENDQLRYSKFAFVDAQYFGNPLLDAWQIQYESGAQLAAALTNFDPANVDLTVLKAAQLEEQRTTHATFWKAVYAAEGLKY